MDLAAVPMYFVRGHGDGLEEIPFVAVIGADESAGWAVARVIRSEGFRVEVFRSAEQFIRSDQMSYARCLVLDVQLPGMTGLQVQSHLASAGHHIPIIFVTSSAGEKARMLALEFGAVNLLNKSSGERALLKEVRLILKSGDKEERTSQGGPERSEPKLRGEKS